MTHTGDFETEMLDALTRAVANALERKRRLGQYAVVWQDGRAVCIGPDPPTGQSDLTHERESAADDVTESGSNG